MSNFQDLESKHGGLLTLGHGLERKIWLLRQEQQLDSLKTWGIYQKAVCAVGKQYYIPFKCHGNNIFSVI
jgi:hypothetical protein